MADAHPTTVRPDAAPPGPLATEGSFPDQTMPTAEERAVALAVAAAAVADAVEAAHVARDAALRAAQALAGAAERAAALVQQQAHTTATALRVSAAMKAQVRDRVVASGSPVDVAEMARAVARDVEARVSIAAQQVKQAADIVAAAVATAARSVEHARAVDEHRIGNEVAAARWIVDYRAHASAAQRTRARLAHEERVAAAPRPVEEPDRHADIGPPH